MSVSDGGSVTHLPSLFYCCVPRTPSGSSSSSNASMERDQRGGVASWNSNSGAGKK